MEKDTSIFINHILEDVRDIALFMRGVPKEEFFSNKEKINAVLKSIENIGEAVKNLKDSFKKEHPEIEWRKIAGTRDVIIHRYFDVDLDTTWEIITDYLPLLEKQLKRIKL